jgi:hypothetical protein
MGDGLASISQILNVRRLEFDFIDDTDEEFMVFGERKQFVAVICFFVELKFSNGFVNILSSLPIEGTIVSN